MKVKKQKEIVQMSRAKLVYILLGLSVLCIGIGLLLGVKVFRRIEHRPLPITRQTNSSLIQVWMTLPYISRTYGVPMEIFAEKLSVKPDANRRSSIEVIARKYGKDPQVLLKEVQSIVSSFVKP